MATNEELGFEVERRLVLFHDTTSMPGGSQLGYQGDPNDAINGHTEGETLLYNCPSGTRYLDKTSVPYIRWVKVEDALGGIWERENSSATSTGPEKTTLLTIHNKRTSGCVFYVNSSGTYYIKEKEDGYLGASASEFNLNEGIQIYLNGANLVKGEHVIWDSSVSFSFGFDVDPGDFVKVVS